MVLVWFSGFRAQILKTQSYPPVFKKRGASPVCPLSQGKEFTKAVVQTGSSRARSAIEPCRP